VDAQGTTPLGDADQTGHEARQLLGQPGELVHDDHETGEWHGVG
jgi:hypothetical protein